MEADGDAAADAAADADAIRRNRRALAARMKRAADAAATGRSVRQWGEYRGSATPEQHRQQPHSHVPPSPLTRPSMAEVDDEQELITITYDHYLTLVRLAAQSVDEGASSSSSTSGSLAWDVEKNLMLQYAADDEWRFGVDDQFASIDFGADEDEEHDEDEELRLALDVSLADMHVRDSQ